LEDGTTFWHDAIEKEMKNVLSAFEFYDDDKVINILLVI
jgi:hypothetical protein